MTVIKVLLVDDHPVVRAGLAGLLSATDDLEVVGEAADVEQAVAIVTATRPDVVLLDVHLPGGGGVEVLRRCAPLMPGGTAPAAASPVSPTSHSALRQGSGR